MFKGFQEFLFRGNVVDLAVAVIIGSAFGAIVTALVKDLITPLIGSIGGSPDFSGITFTVNNSKFFIGDFINALIGFVIISAVIYLFIVIPMNKIMARMKKGQTIDPTEKSCPKCLSQIPLKATRCKFCTSTVK